MDADRPEACSVPVYWQTTEDVRNWRPPPHRKYPGTLQATAPVVVEMPTVLNPSRGSESPVGATPTLPTSSDPETRKSQP